MNGVPNRIFVENLETARVREIEDVGNFDYSSISYDEKVEAFHTLYDVLMVSPIDYKNKKQRHCVNLFEKYKDNEQVIRGLDEYFNKWQKGTDNPMFKYLPPWAQEHIQNREMF